ncbi:DUF475 domain-containing protein [Altererythrobacter sp. BO-6]|uniref:DUF475 domain-containing protein n=1 Tax=Altererythrobacter sp. BO-6 TaxID=2604537 RepID=UPI0013E1393B|nr:DUF475 domain-containing protein [Altererythrobacter sp. BO-6]QIG53078.1 DUF475 domain-containing protein [Altererythrobacter sp. BO-6]
MQTLIRYYGFSLAFSAVCLGLAVWYGWASTGDIAATLGILWIVFVLSILEVSLSFDNAVVNATVLRRMDPVWQRRFLTWGILIAVFGMRIIFPIAIVAIAAQLGPIDAINLSLNNPDEYERIVSAAHIGIAGFGGAFLAMVGLTFFFEEDKEIHWISVLERNINRFSSVPAIEIGLVLSVIYGVSTMLAPDDAITFLTAGILGLVTYIGVQAVAALLEEHEAKKRAAGVVVKSGLGGFLYLEVLDASFSFDGVIGAFALSNNMVIIALGLSVGAIFVRSITIHLVQTGTLAQYRYLEHGAFWAIIVLGAIMLFSAKFHIPETITGLIGATLIGLSFWWSVRHNRREGTEKIDLNAAPKDA